MKKSDRFGGAIEIPCCAPQHARIAECGLRHRVSSAADGIENDTLLPPGEALHRGWISGIAMGQYFFRGPLNYSIARANASAVAGAETTVPFF